MGIFGFASSYDPNQQGGGAPASTIAQTVPGYAVADPAQGGGGAGAGGVDWNMSANNPLKSWGTYLADYNVNRHGGAQALIDDAAGNGAQVTANYRRMAYANPLNNLFGTGGMVNLGDNQATSSLQTPTWSNMNVNSTGTNLTAGVQPTLSHEAQTDGMPVDARNLAFHNEAQINAHNARDYTANMPYQTYGNSDPWSNQYGTDAKDPNSLQGLYSRMNNLSPEQLMALSNNLGSRGTADSYTAGTHVFAPGTGPSGVVGAYQQAEQNIRNNYANQDYTRANSMSQGDSINWLQASYNTLTNKLNKSFLL